MAKLYDARFAKLRLTLASEINLKYLLTKHISNSTPISISLITKTLLFKGLNSWKIRRLLASIDYLIPADDVLPITRRIYSKVPHDGFSNIFLRLLQWFSDLDVTFVLVAKHIEYLNTIEYTLRNSYPKAKLRGRYTIEFIEQNRQDFRILLSKLSPTFLVVGLGDVEDEEFIRDFSRALPKTVILGVKGALEYFGGNKKAKIYSPPHPALTLWSLYYKLFGNKQINTIEIEEMEIERDF